MFYILDSNFTKVAEITSFYSILWRTLYLSQSGGDFEIQLPLEEYSYINKDYLIYNSDDYKLGIIKTIKKEDIINDEVKQIITISGEMGTSILKNRIIFPKINKKGKISSIISDVLNDNIINPSQSSRKINNFSFFYSSTQLSDEVAISAKGETVAELIESLCSQVEAGMQVTYNLDTKKITLNCTIADDVSDKVVFCKEDNNLSNFTYLTSSEKLYTHCIVEGDNNISTTVTNESKKGIFRKEMYLDKTSDETDNISISDYKQQLKSEGTSELLKHTREEASEFDIILNNYQYGRDFTLGSVVTIRYSDLGIDLKVRVLGVLIAIDENGVEEMTLTLGTITKIELKQDEEDDNEETTESESTNTNSVATVNTSYIPVYSENYGTDKIIGGILKLSDDTYLFNLTSNYYDENSESSLDRIYYECDEDLLKNEIQIGINCSNSVMYLQCPGTQEDGKWYYELSGIYSYFSLSKIITRGITENDESGNIDETQTYYAIALGATAVCSTWYDYYDINTTLSSSLCQDFETKYTAYYYKSSSYNFQNLTDVGYSNLLYLSDYKNSLGSEVTITFKYDGTETPFIITEDEYNTYYNEKGYEAGTQNLINAGCTKRVIKDGYTYTFKEGETFYIMYSSSYSDIYIKSCSNKYGTCYYLPSEKYITKDSKLYCSNGSEEDNSAMNYEYVNILNGYKYDANAVPEYPKSCFYNDFYYDLHYLELIDGHKLESIDYGITVGRIAIIKDVTGLFNYSQVALGDPYPYT